MSRVYAACVVLAVFACAARPAHAQGPDSLLNGAVIGAAIGAGAGAAFTYAVRDSDLVPSQYARSAVIFGAIGAGIGLGVDALFNRASAVPGVTPRRVSITPSVWRDIGGVVLKMRW
jgi:hypothetical protein